MENVERNLLFAVLALQNNFIDQEDLIAAFHAWSSNKAEPLSEFLLSRHALSEGDRAVVEVLIAKHLRKYGGDVQATLGAVAGAAGRDAIRSVDDPELRTSLNRMPPPAGHVLIETLLPDSTNKRSRYTLTRLHAQGGLGRVWLAHDNDLNRHVALKEITANQSHHPDAWRRFLKEAQVTGQLEHPSIVPVYELARRPEDDQPFYTMRFVRGKTMRQTIADLQVDPKKSAADSIEMRTMLQGFVNVCQAIAYAHSRRVIHRDLKPENVVLGAFGEVVVLDWGLAKMLDQPDDEEAEAPLNLSADATPEATRQGGVLGTLAYMSPEQAEGRLDLIDGRTDVYGLGAILFEILTGRPPHENAKTMHEMLYRIASCDSPRVRSRKPPVPAALDAICAKAMMKTRADRYKSASDLASDIQRWLADQPVSAHRESGLQHLRRWGRRNRAWTYAGAATLVFVTVVSLVASVYINGARDIAERRRRQAENAQHKMAELIQIDHRRATEKAALAEKLAKALESEVGARNAERIEHSKSQEHLARYYFQRSEAALQNGRTNDGLVYLGYALTHASIETPRPGSASTSGLVRVVRTDLSGWSTQVHKLQCAINAGAAAARFPNSLEFSRFRETVFEFDGTHIVALNEGGLLKVSVETLSARKIPIPHSGRDSALAISPNCRLAVTAGDDRIARLWDINSGRLLPTMMQRDAAITAVVFSPTSKFLAVGCSNGKIAILSLETGRRVELLPADENRFTINRAVVDIVFSQQDRYLVAGRDGEIRVFELSESFEPALRWSLSVGHGEQVAVGPDEKALIRLESNPCQIRLRSMNSGAIDGLPIKHSDPRKTILSYAISADSRTIATACDDETVTLWDVATRKPKFDPLRHDNPVNLLAFSPDGRDLATGCKDGTVRLWDSCTGMILSEPIRHDTVESVAFSRDSKWLITSSVDHAVRIWDCARGTIPAESFKAAFENPAEAASSDCQLRLNGKQNGSAQMFAAKTGELIGQPVWHSRIPHDNFALRGITFGDVLRRVSVYSVALSPDGTIFVTGGGDGLVKFWDVSTRKQLKRTIKLQEHARRIRFSRDGKTLLTVGGGRVRLWESGTCSELKQGRGLAGRYSEAFFGPEDRSILALDDKGSVSIWDLESRTYVGSSMAFLNDVRHLFLSRDRMSVIAESHTRARSLWPWPTELEGDAERILLWVRKATNLRPDSEDQLHPMSVDEWQTVCGDLAKRGGDPSGANRLVTVREPRGGLGAAFGDDAGSAQSLFSPAMEPAQATPTLLTDGVKANTDLGLVENEDDLEQ